MDIIEFHSCIWKDKTGATFQVKMESNSQPYAHLTSEVTVRTVKQALKLINELNHVIMDMTAFAEMKENASN